MTSRFQAAEVHQDLLDPDYVDWRAFLRVSDQWPKDEMDAYRLAEVNRILALAATLPGYRDLFSNAGASFDSLSSLKEIERLPIVTKEDIRDRLTDFTLPVDGLEYVTTGGSTGIPFGLYRSRRAFARELASKAHQYDRIGWKEGDRQVVFRGLPIQNAEGFEFFPKFNELRLSSYHLVPERMAAYADLIDEYRPDWLRCYPSSAQLFAQWLEQTGRKLPPMKGVLCASENLYPFQIELLQRVFGGRIFSHYGHYELAVLAGMCETENSYHVMPQYGFAELVAADGTSVKTAGQIGEIIGTSFLMDGTVLLRYRTNDYAVYAGASCPHCGRLHDIWSRIEGRLQDFVITKSGRPISMTAINMHDDIFDDLIQFQFEQRDAGEITFKFIPKSVDIESHRLEMIKTRLEPKLGSDIAIKFEQVDNIPLTKRGKHRFLIQHISLNFGDGARTSLFND